jgi:hypothetical protein
MRIDLRLSADRGGRLLKITARSGVNDGTAAESLRPVRRVRDVVSVFAAAIDAGLFHGPKEGQCAEVLCAQAKTERDERIDEWEMMTPPLDVEAFASLARMFWTVGARALAISQNALAERLTVRTFDEVPNSTARIPPWRVEKHLEDDAKNAVILVCFDKDAAPEVVRETHAVLRAWGRLAAFGGFTGGASFPSSAAELTQQGTELRSEVFATFETLGVGADGWGALWAGLSRIHRHAPIVRVEAQ